MASVFAITISLIATRFGMPSWLLYVLWASDPVWGYPTLLRLSCYPDPPFVCAQARHLPDLFGLLCEEKQNVIFVAAFGRHALVRLVLISRCY